jgi:class 3 adenylate cyclase
MTGDRGVEIHSFLFADLESSTRLWETLPQAMKPALERHDSILGEAVDHSNGRVVKTTGDGLLAVFSSASDGVRACLEAQQRLREEPWGETGPLRVRMGMHAGQAQARAGDYFGPPVYRAARIMAAAHGGQVLLSALAAEPESGCRRRSNSATLGNTDSRTCFNPSTSSSSSSPGSQKSSPHWQHSITGRTTSRHRYQSSSDAMPN